jgi:ribosome-associated protein
VASDKLASNIVLLDVRAVTTVADYFVLCSGDSQRQLKAIHEGIEESLRAEGVTPHHCESSEDSGWRVLDYGDVIVHIFSTTERDYYNLDELWEKAKTVVRMA